MKPVSTEMNGEMHVFFLSSVLKMIDIVRITLKDPPIAEVLKCALILLLVFVRYYKAA